ncbi:MAG: lamin tail domain-containing protein, partial [Phycisphaerales bacterium]|nr:lamin tail domain-containing protein [Phycisphaerales bacterium]
MKRTMMLSALTAVGLFCAAGSAQVVISQVYGGGGNGGGLYRADFIELKNIGNAPVDITGWTVQRTSAGASGNFSAGQSSAPFPAFVLQPGQYYLVEGATGAGTTQPALPSPNLVAGNLTLGASDGKVALVNSSTIISITNPAHFDQTTMNPIIGGASPIVDFVGYGANASHYEGFDGTPNLGNSLAAIRLNNGCTDTNDNSLDFIVGTPEPHAGGSIVACGAAFPDVAIQLSNSACNPTAGSSFEVTASVSNLLGTGAQGTVATIVLPPTLSFTSVNTGGVGTTAYDAATRTLTWNLGTVAGGGSASATVAATAVAEGGVVVRGSVTTTTANDPVGNNAAVSYSEALSTAAPLGVIAVASSSDTSVATSVDENGTERKLGTIYRPFASANGEWIVFRTDLASLPGTSNTGVVVGHNTGSGWVFALVAREGATAPVAGQPTWVIDASTFGNVLGINDAGEYVYTARLRDTLGTAADNTDDVLHWVLVKGTVSGGVSLVIKGGDTNHAGNADADPAVAAELAGRDYITVGSSTIQNDGTVSFFATLSGSTTSNAAFLTDGGATMLAQKGVTVPGGSTTPWASLDSDVSSDGRGLFVSANGASWLGTGAVDTGGDTSTDNAVAVNGT